MEPIKPRQDSTPDQPIRPRPVLNDFAVRARPAMDGVVSPRPASPAQSTPVAAKPQPATTPSAPSQPTALRPLQSSAATPPNAPQASQAPPETAHKQSESDLDLEEHESKMPRQRSTTGHAGLVGFIVFVVLFGLLLSPLLPGKILDNFPGSSATLSTGDQALACINDLQNTQTTQKYDSKLGSPIVYKYATSTTQTGTCDGKAQSAVIGHSSQFNPIGLAINLVLAIVVALVIAKIWKKLFGEKHHY